MKMVDQLIKFYKIVDELESNSKYGEIHLRYDECIRVEMLENTWSRGSRRKTQIVQTLSLYLLIWHMILN